MALYKDAGTNPFASCIPILAQMPIFLALFRVIDQATKENPLGVLTETNAAQLEGANLLGARIADTFLEAFGIGDWPVLLLTAGLVLMMTATTFTTQRQLMRKNMPESALTGPYAQQQKMLLYILPVAFGVGGIFFPVGVLLYWTTSNLWTMGQQFYVIRNNPAPGTPAFDAKLARDIRKGKVAPPEPPAKKDSGSKPQPKRQQPKKQSRKKRRGGPRPTQQPGEADA